jgi:hypothetical protein
MKLQNPITINMPDVVLKNGRKRSIPPLVLKKLNITIIDNENQKIVKALIPPLRKQIVLWENDSYTTAGDYTQAQVEARLLEILGDNPTVVLENYLK